MIGVVNYGVGNLRSVTNAVLRAGGQPTLLNRPEDLAGVRGVILPGVGAFIPAMTALVKAGFAEPLRDWAVRQGRPLLGVCLGMQLLARRGTEEGDCDGLGLIEATVRRLTPGAGARVPHIGWNEVSRRRPGTLWKDADRAVCYFVHSYHLCFDDPAERERWVIGTTDHGGEVVAMVESGPVMAAQFHPEKSQRDGLMLLANFIACAARW